MIQKLLLLLSLFFLFDSVIGSKKITDRFTIDSLKAYLKKLPDLWEARDLTQDEENYYKHRLGGEVSEGMKKMREMYDRQHSRLLLNNIQNRATTLPASFDSRVDKWPECRDVISEIQDQSRCENCWAIGVVSMMQDRACISTQGRHKPRLSAIDLTRCCQSCQAVKGDGCKRGYADDAIKYFANKGVVTGGLFNSGQGCLPYPFKPTMLQSSQHSGTCSTRCENSQITYMKDIHYGNKDEAVIFVPDEDMMKKQIFYNGPIIARMVVDWQFIKYTVTEKFKKNKGIYYTKDKWINKNFGGHIVKILGWGENDDGVPYWIVANSWGRGFGDNGVFKIIRGVDEAGIEMYAMAGVYDETRSQQAYNN